MTSFANTALTKFTVDDLRDNAKLLAWFRAMTQIKNAWLKDCDADLLNVFAAAERAIEIGTNPGGLFVRIVRGKLWNKITQQQEDRARQRLRKLRNPERHTQQDDVQ